MEVIPHLPLTVFVPVVDHAGLRIPHIKYMKPVVMGLLVLICIDSQLPVDGSDDVLLVRTPKPPLFHPNGVEVRATYHQIVRLTDDELRINLRYAPLSRAGVDFEEIAHDESISSFL